MTAPLRSPFMLPAEHPVFAGHFPAHPIVPGALLLDEVVRQAGRHSGSTRWTVRSAKFVHPATPGMALEMVLAATGAGLDFRIESGPTLIASGSLQPAEAHG
jgi:3-hydroxymyristoyl/3-hydroxydecanoyl-(acyl carrier protein) dehydratase